MYSKGAELCDETAQFSLALCYHYGKGIEVNPKKAIKWYTVCAKQGNPKAQNNLGQCYLEGFGVKKNITKAKKWFTIAAEQGDPEAQKTLIELFADDSPDAL